MLTTPRPTATMTTDKQAMVSLLSSVQDFKMKTSEHVQLEFKDINVRMGSKQILYNVSGEVHSGEVLAVMGPSGSGKTTLLNVIAGRLAKESGEVTLNAQKLTKRMRKRMCYVTQEDVFLSNLTLKETLYFAAMIRLPDEMPRTEKVSRVQNIMDALDLNLCKDTRMGGDIKRGLSGGEKKRASIGCELLTDPDIMLLDEPTTGLDSSMAFTLMSLLKGYTADHNKTVLVTIHQPSSKMYYMFTRLMLLAKGKVAFNGPADKALDVFEEAGLPCAPHYNPADFMLEVLKQDETSLAGLFRLSSNKEKSHSAPLEKNHVTINTPSEGPVIIDDCYSDPNTRKRWPTGFWTQYKMLMWRTFKQSRGRILAKSTVVSTLVLAVVTGVVWFDSPRTHDSVRDRMGLMFFGTGHMGFVTIFDALLSFTEERAVVLKERSSGMYRLSALYLAKLTSELPLSFTLPVCYHSISYYMGGLRQAPDIFFASLAIMILHVLNCKGIGFMIGPGVWSFQLAVTVIGSCMVSLLLLGGFYSTIFPPWLFWSRYLSVFGHTLSAMCILEFSDLTPIPCANLTTESYPQCERNGTDFVTSDVVLEQLGTVLPIYLYIAALASTLLLYFSLGYVIFRFKGRHKV